MNTELQSISYIYDLSPFVYSLLISGDSFLPQEKQYKGTQGRFLPTTTQKVLYPKPSFLPSSIQSCPTAADTPAAAGMKGLPGLACTPSISFLAGGEMLSAFHLCKRSYMTMPFHQI